MDSRTKVTEEFERARDSYQKIGVDVEDGLRVLNDISLSLHCWQGDDVQGFEPSHDHLKGSGIKVTGSHPGRARTVEELRMDLKTALSLIPGRHRLNLHAVYGEFGSSRVERDSIGPEHFHGWRDWARAEGLGLDFNCTCFSHPKAESGLTLSSKNPEIRNFWIRHVKRCRNISAWLGRELDTVCLHNLWIPDGMKDIPVDRWTHRGLLTKSLDEIFEEDFSPVEMKDSLESKLFGIGSESFVVGSHEFYLGYALTRGKLICLDLGHFHPTESVADKISAILQFSDGLVLHISRGVRWDSDHVVILDDELNQLTREIIRGRILDRTHIALDFFDASMSRIGAWVIGARATLKGLLRALLEPTETLRKAEEEGDYFLRLALLEELKDMPFGAIWEYHCLTQDIPGEGRWIEVVEDYDNRITSKRL